MKVNTAFYIILVIVVTILAYMLGKFVMQHRLIGETSPTVLLYAHYMDGTYVQVTPD